jgi:hypothetical protein
MREIDIRRALLAKMQEMHGDEPDTLIRQELGLCQGFARVDLAVVNGSVHGYEIKSEQDTLVRLSGQAAIYNRALDFVTIVIAPAHAKKVSLAVPSWWGIWNAIQADQGVRFEASRAPSRNSHIDGYALAQLLWREEALQALADRDLARGMRSKPREELWRRLAAALTIEELGSIVRDRLKRRSSSLRSPE